MSDYVRFIFPDGESCDIDLTDQQWELLRRYALTMSLPIAEAVTTAIEEGIKRLEREGVIVTADDVGELPPLE